jgi:hypothetical protein
MSEFKWQMSKFKNHNHNVKLKIIIRNIMLDIQLVV